MSCKIGSQCYIDSKGIDLENKIVPVILSDESKVLRFSWEDGMYDLILEHTEKAVDLKRKDILPVLLQHDTEMLPLGIWQNIRIEDNKLKGDAKFDSEDAKAMEIFGKMSRGFMQTFSVGVTIHDKVLDSEVGNKKTYKATRWEITECSVVTVPAIPNATIGMAAMPDNTKIANSIKGANMNFSQENFDILLSEKATMSEKLTELETKVEENFAALEAKNAEMTVLKADMEAKLSEAIADKAKFEEEAQTRVREAFACGVNVDVAIEMLKAENADKASIIALRANQSNGGSHQGNMASGSNPWGEFFGNKK